MKYQSHPRLSYTFKKHTSRRIRRAAQRMLDHAYFNLMPHKAIAEGIQHALLHGESTIKMTWDEENGTVVVE